jgi:hypothetical protein
MASGARDLGPEVAAHLGPEVVARRELVGGLAVTSTA